MFYVGQCAKGHRFEGHLLPPDKAEPPKSFCERCPVPYCPHFITYKQKKEVTMDENEKRQQAVSGIHGAIDELMVLNRRAGGVLGYDSISNKNLGKEMRKMAAKFRELQQLLEQ